MFKFTITQSLGKARLGRLTTPHGEVQTPVFMPVGTAGTVKGVTPDQLARTGVQIILANTYHLLLRPGPETVAALGGLHGMMSWQGPILTDSGGYQVFSLAHLRKIDDDGVVFQSHVDGTTVELTPASAIRTQQLLGADIIMQLDECPPADATREQVASAVRRSAAWAKICKQAWREAGTGHLALGARPIAQNTPESCCPPSAQCQVPSVSEPQALFAIQQGGIFLDLRAQSAAALAELDLPGYAIGGLSVGEGHAAMVDVLCATDEQLPRHKPRYLMGVGEPRDILAAVAAGVDMFDCVLPTRNGRNAQAFTWHGRLRLRNQRHASDRSPLDPTCDCYACRNFSRGTLRHLFAAKEMLGPTLVSIHNLHFFAQFMAAIRQSIADGTFPQKHSQWVEQLYADEDEDPHDG